MTVKVAFQGNPSQAIDDEIEMFDADGFNHGDDGFVQIMSDSKIIALVNGKLVKWIKVVP